MYDRCALAYYGPDTADTNFPPEAATLAAVGRSPTDVPPRAITCALKLLQLEQALPDAAVVRAGKNAAQWRAWE